MGMRGGEAGREGRGWAGGGGGRGGLHDAAKRKLDYSKEEEKQECSSNSL